jgi:hypothetical protein
MLISENLEGLRQKTYALPVIMDIFRHLRNERKDDKSNANLA